MAEAIVGPLVSKLQELALSEGKALVAVSGDIGRLRDKLMWLLAFLQEAEPGLRAHGGQLMRVLVHQIRDAAFSSEDAIDEYSVRVDLSRYPGWSRPALGFLAGFTTQLRVRHNLSGKIAAINNRLEGIVSNKSTFSLKDTASSLSVKMWTASAASSSESRLCRQQAGATAMEENGWPTVKEKRASRRTRHRDASGGDAVAGASSMATQFTREEALAYGLDGGVAGEQRRSGGRRGVKWREGRTGMPVLTSVVVERVRMAGGEDDDLGAAWLMEATVLRIGNMP